MGHQNNHFVSMDEALRDDILKFHHMNMIFK
jgi:hypothetical protein